MVVGGRVVFRPINREAHLVGKRTYHVVRKNDRNTFFSRDAQYSSLEGCLKIWSTWFLVSFEQISYY